MLLYRIVTSRSKSKMVTGLGMLSEMAFEAHEEGQSPFHIPAEFPDPKTAPHLHIIMRHLKGSHFKTPYISLTPSFDRAVLFALSASRKYPEQCPINDTVLYVIDSERLLDPPLNATLFWRDFKDAMVNKNKTEYNRVYMSVNNSQEHLALRAIPEQAIVSAHHFGTISPLLPPWFFDNYSTLELYQPEANGSSVFYRMALERKWNIYVEDIEKGIYDLSCQEACLQLARVLLNAPDTLEGDTDVHFLSLVLSDRPISPPFVTGLSGF